MSAADVSESPRPAPPPDYPRVGLISLGHLTNDLYGNLMTSLTPYLILRGAISATLAGFVVLVYLIGSSVLQPIFGLLSDRTGRRYFATLGPIWIGVAASLFGWAGNAALLMLLAALGGVGTAAFHPQAATMVAQLGERSRGWTMSIFSLGGNVGFALGPVVAAAIAAVGLHWTPIILLPGIGLTLLLVLFAPHPARTGGQARSASIRKLAASRWRPLGLIVAVIAIRSGAQFGIIFFLPLYFHARGYAPQLGSFDAFLLSIAGALGGLVGGRLSDVYGRRPIVVGSLALTAPLLAAALLVSPPFAWPLITLAGAALLASNSVTVVQGQELLPENTGIASGLTLGFGFGLSGVITTSMAALSDHVGVSSTILLVPALALLAALLSFFITDSREGGARSPLTPVPPLRAPAGGQ